MISPHTMTKRNRRSAIIQKNHSSATLTTDTTVQHRFTSGVRDNQKLNDLNNNNNVKTKYGNKLKGLNKIKSTEYQGNDAFSQNKLPKIVKRALLSSIIASSSSKRSVSALACPSSNGTFFNEKSMSFYSKPIKQTNSNTNKLVINKVLEKPLEVLTAKDKEKNHIELDAIHLQLSHKSSSSSQKSVLTDTINSSRIKSLSKLPEIDRAPSRASTDPHIQTNQQRDTVRKEINKALKVNTIEPFYGQDKQQLVATVRLNDVQKMALKGKAIVAKSANTNNSLNRKLSMFQQPECCSVGIEEIRSKTPRGKDNNFNQSNAKGSNVDKYAAKMSIVVTAANDSSISSSEDRQRQRTGSVYSKHVSMMIGDSGTQRKSISNQPIRKEVKGDISYDSTYQLDPVVGYVYKWTVGKLIVEYVANSILRDYKYSCNPVENKNSIGSSSSLKCQDISQMVIRKLTSFDFRRYRYVCHTALASLKGQGLVIADRQLFSRPYDYTYTYTIQGGSFRKNQWVAVISLWAIYMD